MKFYRVGNMLMPATAQDYLALRNRCMPLTRVPVGLLPLINQVCGPSEVLPFLPFLQAKLQQIKVRWEERGGRMTVTANRLVVTCSSGQKGSRALASAVNRIKGVEAVIRQLFVRWGVAVEWTKSANETKLRMVADYKVSRSVQPLIPLADDVDHEVPKFELVLGMTKITINQSKLDQRFAELKIESKAGPTWVVVHTATFLSSATSGTQAMQTLMAFFSQIKA